MWTSLGLFSLGLSVLPGPGYLFPSSHWGSFRPLFLRITSLPFVCVSSFWNSCNVNVSALTWCCPPGPLPVVPSVFGPWDWCRRQFFHGLGRRGGFRMIQTHYTYCTLSFFYYYISSTSHHIRSQRFETPCLKLFSFFWVLYLFFCSAWVVSTSVSFR